MHVNVRDVEKSEPKVYRCEIEVRGYELDSYRHVNHAVYFNYLEFARWKMLESEGLPLKKLDEWKRWPVVAGLEAKYLKPTYMGDRLTVETRIVGTRRVAFEIEHRVLRGTEEVFHAKVHAVIINEHGRPADMPPEMTRLWEKK